MEILFEDQDILVLRKPAGLPTQTAGIASRDMVSEIKKYLKTQGNRDLYVGLVHRLDQPVEGILVFAKNAQAATNLSRQVSSHEMKKYYYAAVEGIFLQDDLEKNMKLTDYMVKDAKTGCALIVSEKQRDAKKAELIYHVLVTDQNRTRSLLRIQLMTGRFHQIRAQLSNIGHPIVNDTKYGTAEAGNSNGQYSIGLCAYRLEFRHPKTGKMMEFHIEPSVECIRTLWTQLPD